MELEKISKSNFTLGFEPIPKKKKKTRRERKRESERERECVCVCVRRRGIKLELQKLVANLLGLGTI